MTLPPQGTRPHGHRRDRSQPQAEAQAQDPGRHRSLRLGPRTAQRSHRGVGVVSSQSCPRPCAPTPAARSRTRFIYHRGSPTRTHVSRKRGKWSRIAGVRRSHTRVPGECSPGPVQCLPGDRHPIPREGIPIRGPHIAIHWEGGQEKARHWVWGLRQLSRTEDSRAGVGTGTERGHSSAPRSGGTTTRGSRSRHCPCLAQNPATVQDMPGPISPA